MFFLLWLMWLVWSRLAVRVFMSSEFFYRFFPIFKSCLCESLFSTPRCNPLMLLSISTIVTKKILLLTQTVIHGNWLYLCDRKFLFLLLNDWRVGLPLGWKALPSSEQYCAEHSPRLSLLLYSRLLSLLLTSLLSVTSSVSSSDSCSEWSNSSRSSSWPRFSSTLFGRVLFFEAGSIEKRVICFFVMTQGNNKNSLQLELQ